MQCRTPTPIFNQRRRQRQAVYADINPNTDLMPVGGFSNPSTSSSKCNLNTNPRFQRNNNRGNLNQSNVRNGAGFCASNADTNANVTYKSNGAVIGPPGSRMNIRKSDDTTMNRYCNQTTNINRGNHHQPTTSRGKNNMQANRGNFNNYNTTFQPHQRESQFNRSNNHGSPSPKQKYRRSGYNFSQNKTTIGYQTNNGAASFNNYDGRCQEELDYTDQYQQRPSSTKSSASSGVLFHSASGDPISAPKRPAPGANLPPSMFQSDNLCQTSTFNSVTETSYSSGMRNYSPGTATISENGMGQTPIKPVQKIDKTMKFITASISGIKQWSKFDASTCACPIMFEVFGLLDSAVLKNNDGIAKDFILRDGDSTLQCVFHEIDRVLPRLVRGQWHRCVGNLEYKSGKMKCVVIRPTNNEEIKAYKVVSSIAEKVLKKYDNLSNNEQ